MAGLLFVFILLIGAIVSKSMIMREDLHKKENRLEKAESLLAQKKKRLNLTQTKLKQLTAELDSREAILREVNSSLVDNKLQVAKQKDIIVKDKKKISSQEKLIDLKEKMVASQTKEIIQKKTIITEQKEQIRLQAEEVRKLHLLLTELQSSIKQADADKKQLSGKLLVARGDLNRTQSMLLSQKELGQTKEERIGQLQALITLTKDSLKLKESELEKLNQLLLARNSKVDTLSKKIVLLQNLTQESNTTLAQKQKKLQEYVGRVIVLSNSLTDKEQELKLKDKKLATLLDALDKKKTRYDDLVAKLQSQKAQIRSLTGIKLKVIAALKETLGDKINIDKRSGALRLSSNILFDKGSSELKDESKEELRSAFEDYIGALVTNQAIRPHLDRIVIEGHTDSDGTYLYNLKLSQERALAVMQYLLTLPIAQKYHLKKYLVASGRAYLDSVQRGMAEDKEASRRIEIKFQLKNQDAMHEIERILDDGKRLF
jgi:chemotaxis protein MotB